MSAELTTPRPTMNDHPEHDADRAPCGWTRLYSPRGALVTLPVTETPLDYAALLANVEAMLAAGFLVTAPGLEEGEEKDDVGWVLHGEHEHDGRTTPFVLLYSRNESLTWSFLKVYLNKPDDVAAFEFASKMRLANIPLYIGDDKPQRGASQKTARFIVAPPKPFGVVFKKNPKHDPSTEEGKMKPARLFVRWADQKPVAEPSTDAGDVKDAEIAAKVQEWADALAAMPSLGAVNLMLPDLKTLPQPLRGKVWNEFLAHAKSRGWEWDANRVAFIEKQTAPQDEAADEIPF